MTPVPGGEPPLDVDALQARLAAAGIHTLCVQFTDLDGQPKGKWVPLHQLAAVLAEGAGFAGPSIRGTGLPRQGERSEYLGRGDPATVHPLDWLPGVARIVADGHVGGRPFEACPRRILRRAVDRLAARGWRLRTGIEPEFFLLRRDAAGRWAPADAEDRLDKPSYDLRSLARQGGFLQALRRALEAAGLTVLQIDHEDAPGQYELNLRHDEVLRSADHLMLVRLAGRALAEAHGAVFSCMPKPFADQPGSGLHVHASLWQDTGDGGPARNLFAGESSDPMHPQALSPLAQHFVAGLLAHSPALCALAAPTVNSYRRLAVRRTRSGTSWAPASISHGPNNRTAQVRTLADRIEWRLPDAAANPYLLSAGLIAAGLDGIDRALPLPPACRDDLFELDAPARAALGIGALPASLAEALDTFEASALLREALGPEAHREFLALGRAQWDEYAGHVSDWEWARWADA